MLTKSDYDIIYIANPPFLHYESLEKAIKTKKPIICEKPLDNNYTNGLKIKELLKGYPSSFMVAHHLRHQKAYDDIIASIASREIGDVVEVYCQWGFKLNATAPNAVWKLDPSLGGEGTFSDNGVHIVDFILGIFGVPDGVFGHCFNSALERVFDNETAMLCYANKTITLSSSQNMSFPGNNIQIYGTKGKIEIFGGIGEKSISRIFITTSEGEKKLEYQPTHLYGAEVENFVKHYLLNDSNANKGTTLDEAITSLRIIDLLRKSSNEKTYYSLNL
jgi:predicted dehydrogenase